MTEGIKKKKNGTIGEIANLSAKKKDVGSFSNEDQERTAQMGANTWSKRRRGISLT